MTSELATNIAVVLNYEIVRINENPIYNVGEIFKSSRNINDRYISLLAKVTRVKNNDSVVFSDDDLSLIMSAYSSFVNNMNNLLRNEVIESIRASIDIELQKMYKFWGEFEKIKNNNG